MMGILVIGSEEMVAAFALGGMAGRVAAGRGAALQALGEAQGLPGVRLLVVEEGIADLIREEIDRARLDPRGPLIVEVPGVEGPQQGRPGALELVRGALGLG